MNKLALYVKRTVFITMLASVIGLWLLQLLFVYLSELEYLNASYRLMDALRFIIYRSAHFLVLFMPTGVLLGAVIGLGMLAKNSEPVVMRAAGISLYRLIGWVLQPAYAFVILALVINQCLLPTAQYQARQIKNPAATFVSLHGYRTLTTDNTNPDKRHIVLIDQADSQGNLSNIKRFTLTDGKLSEVLMAPTGQYTGQGDHYQWQLSDVNTLAINDKNATAQAQQSHHANLTLPIAKDSVHLLTREPTDMSISDLYQHAILMRHQNTDSLKHRLVFWQKLLSPFAILSLVLVACSFVFGSLRTHSLGLRIVMALLTGLLFSYIQDLMGFIALAMGISPALMVLLPIIISAIIGLWLIAKKG